VNRVRVRRWVIRGSIAAVIVPAIVMLVVSSGVVSVKASTRHWAITNWFLHYAMRRSVSTYSKALPELALDDPWLVLKGAGHYETGCRPCHGAPDLAPPVIPHAMTPYPPELSSVVPHWSPKELFYVVKHGIKPTAMPAWPTQQRDDEVTAIVAFLLQLPKLDATSYRQLVDGDTGPTQSAAPISDLVASDARTLGLATSCARCHGASGEGRGSAAFPKLAGQKSRYQYAALQAYARGDRHSGIMQPIAASLTETQMRALSDYYDQLAPEAPIDQNASARAEQGRGARIAAAGIPERGVPACMECHGPGSERRSAFYPRLAGQYADYLLLQLRLFKARKRGGSPYAHLMHHVSSQLEDEQMIDVARYYAALPAEHGP
jgi:cytochrome c553